MDHKLIELAGKVHTFSLQNQLFEPNAKVYVAVSGGADSMALLRVLQMLKSSLQITLEACHVNHCLNGAISDADEAFVRAECKRLDVPLTVFHAIKGGQPPPANAGELWARNLRYGYFAQLTNQQNAFMAIAHTLNDQTETLLFRLARGAGVHGAAGIRPKRGVYLRPFLCITRAEVEAFCNDIGQAYVIDPTNLKDVYARNHLRIHAVPALCYANESAVPHVGKFCEKMAEIDRYFQHKALKLLEEASADVQPMGASQGFPFVQMQQGESGGVFAEETVGVWSVSVLQNADKLELEAAMHHLVRPYRDVEQKYVDALCNLVQTSAGALQVTKEIRFVVENESLQCRKNLPKLAKMPQSVEYYPVKQGEYFFPGGYRIKLEQITPEIMEKIHLVHKKDLKNYADYDKIKASTQLRCRKPGDTFAPMGRGVTKTLKKLYNELSVPMSQRNEMPLLADASKVVWLWGQGFAEGYAPTEHSTLILKITEDNIMEDDVK